MRRDDKEPAVRFILQQQWAAFRDAFAVKDETGREQYTVRSDYFSWGKHLTMSAATGSEVAEIRQVLFSWGLAYDVFYQGTLVAKVTKDWFTFGSCRFTIDVPGPDDLLAQGDFWDHEYVIRRGEETVATVSKKWFAWTDTYAVDVPDPQYVLLVLACVLVIDCCCHDRKD